MMWNWGEEEGLGEDKREHSGRRQGWGEDKGYRENQSGSEENKVGEKREHDFGMLRRIDEWFRGRWRNEVYGEFDDDQERPEDDEIG